MDYLVTHATEIMQLCFGFGFLILVAFCIRPLILLTRVLAKIDDLSDLFIEYLEKPLRAAIRIYSVFSEFTKFFGKK